MVRATTRSATEGTSFGMREGRVLSRRSPSTPSAANRSCQRQTQVLGLAGLAHDRVRADALGAEQHDLRPPNVLLRRVAVFDQSVEPIKVGGRDRNGNAGSHATDSHAPSPPRIPHRDSNVRRDPLASHHCWPNLSTVQPEYFRKSFRP
jgi:hypothetical protein